MNGVNFKKTWNYFAVSISDFDEQETFITCQKYIGTDLILVYALNL